MDDQKNGNYATTTDVLWRLSLSGPVTWRLSVDGRNEATIPGFEGWSVVTPIGCARMDLPCAETDWPYNGSGLLRTVDNKIFVEDRDLWLRYKGATPPSHPSEVGKSTLSRLRYVSRQHTVPRSIRAFTPRMPRPYADSYPFWNHDQIPGFEVREDLFHCAITENDLETFSNLPNDFSIPIHVDVLLDALDAHVEGDYRKAILYAAIAAESIALARLEEEYSSSCAKAQITHRFIDLRVSGDTFTHKDPVYEALSKGDHFERLLHERPLYLFGRSMLVEQPEMYRRALQLYTTRNKIAHKGTSPNDEKHFSLSNEGSVSGLAASIDVFHWFGDNARYVVPSDFVDLCKLPE